MMSWVLMRLGIVPCSRNWTVYVAVALPLLVSFQVASEMAPLAISGLAISGFAISGLAMSGFAISGLAMSGLAMSGLAISGLAMSGLAMSGLAISGLAMSGLAMSGLARSGLSTSAVAISGLSGFSGSGLSTIAPCNPPRSLPMAPGLAISSTVTRIVAAGSVERTNTMREMLLPAPTLTSSTVSGSGYPASGPCRNDALPPFG